MVRTPSFNHYGLLPLASKLNEAHAAEVVSRLAHMTQVASSQPSSCSPCSQQLTNFPDNHTDAEYGQSATHSDTTNFPWATTKELETGSILKRRVSMGERGLFHFSSSSALGFSVGSSLDEDFYWVLDVVSSVGKGKSGEVFKVVVADIQGCTRSLPRPHRHLIGQHLILKLERPDAPEPLSHEASIMKKMKGVPNTVQLLAQTMRTSVTWSTHAAILILWPLASRSTKLLSQRRRER